VDVQAGRTLGRASRSVPADEGEEMVRATLEVAADIRAALGLTTAGSWNPIMAVLLKTGASASDFSGAEGSIDNFNFLFEAEADLFLSPAWVLFLQVGTRVGFNGKDPDGQPFEAWFMPVILGAKYRFVRPWITPYAGLGVGASLLQLKEVGGSFNLKALAGMEFNPWQRFGLCLEGAFLLSQFFDTGGQNYFQVGGEVGVCGIYRF
jgi:opacity protein-like surface antigen